MHVKRGMTTALTAQQLAAAVACPPFPGPPPGSSTSTQHARYGIDTPERAAHFLAQISVESAALSRLEESLFYTAERLVSV